MQHAPLVSVIIPTFNYGQYLCQAIDSVLASTFPQSEIEIIVIDDGSIDDTAEKVRSYGGRISYLLQTNEGKASATRVGIEQSQGKYLFNLDADDLFLPEKIEKVVNIFESDIEIVHVGHPALCWNVTTGTQVSEKLPHWVMNKRKNGREVLRAFYKKKMLFGGGSTLAARTDMLKSCPIDRKVDMYIDEYLVLMALNQGDSYFIEEPLSVWRIHGENYSELPRGQQCLTIRRNKGQRSMESMLAVCSAVVSGDFDRDIKMLYTLKTKVSQLAIDEEISAKSYADVFNLWKYTIKTIPVFGRGSVDIMLSYGVLNRTLPRPLLRLVKEVRGRLLGLRNNDSSLNSF